MNHQSILKINTIYYDSNRLDHLNSTKPHLTLTKFVIEYGKNKDLLN